MIAHLTAELSNRKKSDKNRDGLSFFRMSNVEDCKALEILLHDQPNCVVLDEIHAQLRDLIKLENPTVSLSELDYQEKISFKLNGRSFHEFGVWIYYPWKDTLVHVLDEDDFIQVRTIRNAYKISPEEQAELRNKKIGVVGLSVGQSAVMALAMERIDAAHAAEIMACDAGIPLVERQLVGAGCNLQLALVNLRHQGVLLPAERAIAGIGALDRALDLEFDGAGGLDRAHHDGLLHAQRLNAGGELEQGGGVKARAA